MRRHAPNLGALLLYLLGSVACFGRGVVRDPSGSVVGSFGSDQGFFMWSLVHWQRVLEGREHALLTDLIYYPDGFNLAWATTIPGPAILAAPLTALLGPEPVYNLLALAAPTLAAFCAYLLCRELTDRVGPALLGGAIFGFSSYVTAEMLNHLNLALAFPVPLAVLLVVRHVRGRTSDRRLVLGMAAVLVAQFSIFTELLLGLVVFGGAAGLLALALAPRALRPALLRAALLVVAGSALAGLLVAPYVWYAFAHPNPIHEGLRPDIYSADAANVLYPTHVTALGGHRYAARAARFTGNLTEQLAYIPFPLLLLVLAFTATRLRSYAGRLVPLALLLPLVCALGPRLVWEGHPHWRLPWHWIGRQPVLHYALPTRFMVHAWLALAVMAALFVAQRGRLGAARWSLALAGLLLLLPSVHGSLWRHRLDEPRFFLDGTAQRRLGREPVVVLLPYGFLANGMYWQAKTGMAFRQAGGYASSVIPDPYLAYPVVPQLYDIGAPVWDVPSFLRLLHDKRVTHVVVDARFWLRYRGLLAHAGLIGTPEDGVVVYPVPAALRA